MTLSYQMPLGNVQSYDASGGEGGFHQIIRVPSYGGRGLAKSLYMVTFIVPEKA